MPVDDDRTGAEQKQCPRRYTPLRNRGALFSLPMVLTSRPLGFKRSCGLRLKPALFTDGGVPVAEPGLCPRGLRSPIVKPRPRIVSRPRHLPHGLLRSTALRVRIACIARLGSGQWFEPSAMRQGISRAPSDFLTEIQCESRSASRASQRLVRSRASGVSDVRAGRVWRVPDEYPTKLVFDGAQQSRRGWRYSLGLQGTFSGVH
jgi:hypothetical protein